MIKKSNNKPYDLEERTFQFAKEVRLFVKTLKKSIANIEDAKQVVRSSGSSGSIILRQMNHSIRRILYFGLKYAEKKRKKLLIG